MKRKTTGLFALLTAIAILFTLTACGNSTEQTDETAEQETTASAEATAEATAEAAAAAAAGTLSGSESATADDSTAETGESEGVVTEGTADYATLDEGYAIFNPDDVVYTVNGENITWNEFYMWLNNYVTQYEYYYGAIDWSGVMEDGWTYADEAFEYAANTCAEIALILQEADRLGLELSAEDTEYLEGGIQTLADNYYDGDIEQAYDYLDSIYMTEEYYFKVNEAYRLTDYIYDYYYGENGEKLSDEDFNDYVNNVGLYHAKHILLMTIDSSTYEALDDEAIAQKKAEADELLATLRAQTTQDELLAKFDELMNEKSEDTGLANYPDGYYFTTGEMVESFENATAALGINEVSEVVESTYGYHIILRLYVSPDDIIDSSDTTARDFVATELYNDVLDEWIETNPCEATEIMQSVEPAYVLTLASESES